MPPQDGLDSINASDVVIAVMGATGVGKSSFIHLATGNGQAKVGHSLHSETATVQLVKCSRNGRNYVFLDTPGFNDTAMTDADVLTNIVVTLARTYEDGIKLSGVIYLHRISDNRVTMTGRRNAEMFMHLCGPDAFQNVILVTTMWDHVEKEKAEQREMQLHTTFWNSMIESGSRMMRFGHTRDSAWEIVDCLNGVPRPLQIQEEIVVQRRKLSQTAAGKSLFGWFTKLANDFREQLRKLKETLGRNKKASKAYSQDKARIKEIDKNLKQVEEQKKKLDLSSSLGVARETFSSTPHIPDDQRPASAQGIRDQTRVYVPFRRATAPATISASPPSLVIHREDQVATSKLLFSTLVSRHLNEIRLYDESSVKARNLTKGVKNVSQRAVNGGGCSDIHQGDYGTHKVAIKVIRVFDDSRAKNIAKRLLRELDIWTGLGHPNIVPLMGYVNNLNRLPSPVSPWYRNGDAANYLERSGHQIKVKSRLRLLLQVAAGLQYLHQQEPSIIHGDLKPGNILIDDNGVAQLCDFGLARLGKGGTATITGTVMFTRRYAAPELYSPKYRSGKVTETTRTDIYSLACVGYRFLYLKRPYADKEDSELIYSSYSPPAKRSREDWHPILQEHVSICWALFEDCWLENQSKRPDIDHFIEQIDDVLSDLISTILLSR